MIDANEFKGVQDFLYYRQVRDDIRAYLDGTKELIKAETTHFGQYDYHFKWLKGEITGFAGIPNHGKSKFTIFLSALKMYYSDWKIAVYSPETSPSEFLFANYLHTLSGKGMFGKNKPTKKEIAPFEELLENNLFLCDPEKMPTVKGIMNRFRQAHEYHGCDMFIIDPFNCLDREWEMSQRDDRYVGDFLDKYRDFAKHTNTCGVVVSHPKGGMKPKKDSLDYECPTGYDLAGGAMWMNKLDNLVFIHRPNFIGEFKDTSVLARHSKIKKREIVGQGGDAFLHFDFRTNRYAIDGIAPDFGTKNVQAIDVSEPSRDEDELPF